MSIIIKGLNMPKASNEDCMAVIRSNGKVEVWQTGMREFEAQAIQIPTPHGRLANDIKKMTSFIEPCMIIASTYDEQIERAEEVKRWLLSIIEEDGGIRWDF